MIVLAIYYHSKLFSIKPIRFNIFMICFITSDYGLLRLNNVTGNKF